MWRHYKALKKTTAVEGFDPNWKWLTLARTWGMPVRAVKDIINARRGPIMVPVYCCDDYCYVDHRIPMDRTQAHARRNQPLTV